jgi:hypothetical protein
MLPYGGNPHTDAADAIRVLVGDTNASSELLDDNTYALILATESRLYSRGAMAASMLAGKYAKEMTKRTGDLWREAKVQYDHYRDLAQWLRLEGRTRGIAYPFVGGLTVSDNETRREDSTVEQPKFTVGMMDAAPSELSTDEED